MNYQQLAQDILFLIGGKGNVLSFTNCMTRLRLELKDQSKLDVKKIKELDDVQGVVDGQQIQIIVGPGHAQRLRDAFAQISGITASQEVELDFKNLADETKSAIKAKHTTSLHSVLRHVGNIFIPLIPGFIACGLIIAISNLWKTFDPSVVNHPWFVLFSAMGGIVGSLLAVIAGYNSAKEFGGSPILGAIAGALIYLPQLNGLVATSTTSAQAVIVPILGTTLKAGYGGIIGVIFAAFIFATIEKKVRKHVPASLDLFIVPLVTLIIGALITFVIIMPISALIMKAITFVLVDFALKQGGIIGGYILAATFLPLVMLGIHQGLVPIHAQLIASTGYTVLLPVLAMAGAGQVGMAMAIYVKTKDKKLKNIIASALPIGFLGIGEPLIYGVSLPLFYPFITACLGAGFGGAVIAFATAHIADVGAMGMGISGLILVSVIANNMWLWYLLGLISAYIGGFLLTYFFGYKEEMLKRLQ